VLKKLSKKHLNVKQGYFNDKNETRSPISNSQKNKDFVNKLASI